MARLIAIDRHWDLFESDFLVSIMRLQNLDEDEIDFSANFAY